MCKVFAGQDPERYRQINRSVRLAGHATSIQLEAAFWVLIDEIAELIVELRSSNLSIVLVEQNANLALQLSDHGYVLETGSVALSGASDQLLRDPEVARAYLGA